MLHANILEQRRKDAEEKYVEEQLQKAKLEAYTLGHKEGRALGHKEGHKKGLTKGAISIAILGLILFVVIPALTGKNISTENDKIINNITSAIAGVSENKTLNSSSSSSSTEATQK